jgi:peptide deformylase
MITSERSIVIFPHESLKTTSEKISNIDERVRTLAAEMARLMYRAPGVGLAANQVGETLRLIVIDVQYAYTAPSERTKNPIFLINPEISLFEGRNVKEEGCLSVPEFGVEIERPELVQVRGVDLDGNPIVLDAEGILARALQHEIDHLNGTTILDHASSLRRGLYRRKMKKRARRQE